MPRDIQPVLQLLEHFGPQADLRRQLLEAELQGKIQQQRHAETNAPLQAEALRAGISSTQGQTELAGRRDARAEQFMAEQLANMVASRDRAAELQPFAVEQAQLGVAGQRNQNRLGELGVQEAEFNQSLQDLRRPAAEAALEGQQLGQDLTRAQIAQALALALSSANPITDQGQIGQIIQEMFPNLGLAPTAQGVDISSPQQARDLLARLLENS